METNLRKFNKTVHEFVIELKSLFEEGDRDIEMIETFYDMTKVNVRAIITPFQTHILKKKNFAKYIMEGNANYFLTYNFDSLFQSDSPYTKYARSLVTKFKDVLARNLNDEKITKAMFDWFKLMIYYSASDIQLDVKELTLFLENPSDNNSSSVAFL